GSCAARRAVFCKGWVFLLAAPRAGLCCAARRFVLRRPQS
ncbi:hypothetical protein A2U01_0096415, partial [Trifolium medium]|nr:hypothetical protein [Trifolium medium]